ncbi:MAG: hypothetical protein E6H07_12800 [Bacteroidetes bacterium]|nr:MAG: hypothetical protein E6H07_12800 [Bacteroidota bacterium]
MRSHLLLVCPLLIIANISISQTANNNNSYPSNNSANPAYLGSSTVTTPVHKLYVGASVKLFQSGNSGFSSPSLYLTNTTGGAKTYFINSGSTGLFRIVDGDASLDRFVINSAGNIGIGTSSPTYKLDVNGTMRFVDGNQAAGKVLTSDAFGGASWQTPSGGGSSQWGTNGSSIYYNTGNVGVGIGNPAYPFHVSPVIYSTGTASQTGTTINGSGVLWWDKLVGGFIVFADGTRRTITGFISGNQLTVAESGTISSQAYKIHYQGLSVASTGKVTIATADWVEDLLTVQSGIGTWGASVAKFVSVSPYASGTYNTVVCAFAPNVPVGSNINAYQFGKDRISNYNSATWIFKYNGDMSPTNYAALAFWGSPEIVRFNTDGLTELITVKIADGTQGAGKVLTSDANGLASWQTPSGGGGSSQWTTSTSNIFYNTGKVGIGTSNFSDPYKLFVEGSVRARKVRVDQQTWPDYVFHTNYDLLSLKSLEEFIQKNKHLPEVPTAAVVEKEGIDLGDNQAVLLKKIEELTLYIIGLNNKVEKLSAENESIKKQLGVKVN